MTNPLWLSDYCNPLKHRPFMLQVHELEKFCDINFFHNNSCLYTSGVASAIIKSNHWEKAMTWHDESQKSTPMKLLIRRMPGKCCYVF